MTIASQHCQIRHFRILVHSLHFQILPGHCLARSEKATDAASLSPGCLVMASPRSNGHDLMRCLRWNLQNRSQLVNARADKRVKDHLRQKLSRKKLLRVPGMELVSSRLNFFTWWLEEKGTVETDITAWGLLIGNHWPNWCNYSATINKLIQNMFFSSTS